MYIDSGYTVHHHKRKNFSALDKSILNKIKNLDLTEGVVVAQNINLLKTIIFIVLL